MSAPDALALIQADVTFVVGGMTTMWNFMLSNPAALITFAVFVVGAAIGLLSRVFHAI